MWKKMFSRNIMLHIFEKRKRRKNSTKWLYLKNFSLKNYFRCCFYTKESNFFLKHFCLSAFVKEIEYVLENFQFWLYLATMKFFWKTNACFKWHTNETTFYWFNRPCIFLTLREIFMLNNLSGTTCILSARRGIIYHSIQLW